VVAVTVVWVVVVVLVGVALALIAAGLVEVYAQLEQVRTVLRLQDQPTPVHLATLGEAVEELLPEPPPLLRRVAEGSLYSVLVLNSSCAVCQVIGSDLGAALAAADRAGHENPGRSPASFHGGIVVLVSAGQESAAREFLARTKLPAEVAVVDPLGRYAKQLGIDQSPTVVSVIDERLRSAASLSSYRQLEIFCQRERGEVAHQPAG
jgi:hypothetical protein